MREDMSRVIVERPRWGAGHARKGRPRAFEDLPKQEGMARPYRLSGDWKYLNENLSPLRRYLESQVGRPWDKVYSEIARHLRVDSAVQQHVRDHVHDFVAVKPRRRCGTWFRADGRKERYDKLWHQPLYVDPVDGLLKRTDRLPEAKALRRAEQRRPAPPERIALAPDRELRRIKGLWFEVRLANLPEPVYRTTTEVRANPPKGRARAATANTTEVTVRRLVTPAVRDAVTGAALLAGPEIADEQSWKAYRRTSPDRRYAVFKRVLSRTELKRYGLQNLPPED